MYSVAKIFAIFLRADGFGETGDITWRCHLLRSTKRRCCWPGTSLYRGWWPARSLTTEDCSVYLKMETDLPTGSFKPRGALWALSVNLGKRAVREVVASSTGNHGAAVAYAAKTLGVACTIFLPSNPNPTKRAKIAALDAKIVECGASDLASAFVAARDYSQRDWNLLSERCHRPGLARWPGDDCDGDL